MARLTAALVLPRGPGGGSLNSAAARSLAAAYSSDEYTAQAM
jgi:hypothetical protein